MRTATTQRTVDRVRLASGDRERGENRSRGWRNDGRDRGGHGDRGDRGRHGDRERPRDRGTAQLAVRGHADRGRDHAGHGHRGRVTHSHGGGHGRGHR